MEENAPGLMGCHESRFGDSYGSPLTAEEERHIAAEAHALLDCVLDEIAHDRTDRADLLAAFRACEDAPLRARLQHAATVARSMFHRANQLYWRLSTSSPSTVHWEVVRVKLPARFREDLLQLGNIGLLKAARRFEPERGHRFSTLARWWVRAELQEAQQRYGRLVRLPSSAADARAHLARIRDDLTARGEPADDHTLAELTGLPLRRVRLLSLQNQGCSIESDVSGTPLKELLACGHDQEAALIGRQRRRQCAEAFARLTEREQQILTRHLGLGGQGRETLTAIGRDLSLSRERVRQLEKLALQGMAAHID